jgi:hypothetical protein
MHLITSKGQIATIITAANTAHTFPKGKENTLHFTEDQRKYRKVSLNINYTVCFLISFKRGENYA